MRSKGRRFWLKAFGYALNGLVVAFKSEKNMKVHVFAAIVACSLAYLYGLPPLETCVLLMAITVVLVAEIINTAIEKTIDFISPDFHEEAKKIKDMAAGAVLIAALSAAAIGYLLFFEKIFQ